MPTPGRKAPPIGVGLPITIAVILVAFLGGFFLMSMIEIVDTYTNTSRADTAFVVHVVSQLTLLTIALVGLLYRRPSTAFLRSGAACFTLAGLSILEVGIWFQVLRQ